MDLRKLSDLELHSHVKSLAQREREILSDIIVAIKEVDLRRLYLEYGRSSLYVYLVEDIGYSDGAAQRRIDAARLLKEVPTLKEKISSGEITLNQVTLLQQAIRLSEKSSDKVLASEKSDIIEIISDKSKEETQTLVAQYFDVTPIATTKTRHQADGSIRIETTLSKEQYAKLQQVRELLSHSVPNGELTDLLEYIFDKIIKQKTAIRSAKKSEAEPARSAIGELNQKPTQSAKASIPEERTSQLNQSSKNKWTSTATVAVKISDRKFIFNKYNGCQHHSPVTGNQCASKWQLQIDHIKSRWNNGSNDVSNLQPLCAQHNRLKYQKEAGIKYK